MSRIGRAQNVPGVGVRQTYVRDIVQEQRRAAAFDELTHGSALSWFNPVLRLGRSRGHGRIENQFRLTSASHAALVVSSG